METVTFKPEAILLLGLTGAGKTPLGDALQERGLSGRRCFHFDFGCQLRLASNLAPEILSTSELEVINRVLRAGALLEDEQFVIAQKLLKAFITQNNIGTADLIIMNGLPRHLGQARALESIIAMKAVVVLDCLPEIALERIRSNAGGDRGVRVDDTIERVKKRIVLFKERTLPLIEYYRQIRVQRIRLDVGARSTAGDLRLILAEKLRKDVFHSL